MVTDSRSVTTQPPVERGDLTLPGTASGIINVIRYTGDQWAPQDIRRRRRQVMDAMRRFGTPVLIKHRYTDDDREKGVAIESPNMMSGYDSVRHDDPLSHGTGFVSVQTSANEWIDTNGELVTTNPGGEYAPAPYYRGYGPGYLTYIIEPDTPVDQFKLTDSGVLVKTQTATGQAPWFPDMRDNDILINVVLDRMENVIETKERYVLKSVAPISMRGLDRRGGREYSEIGGNRFLINHQFQMALVPPTDPIYNVETDR